MGAIYRIRNKENGKSYIGQSRKPYHRIMEHLSPETEKGSNEIKADLLKYDAHVWDWEVVADEKDYPSRTLDNLEITFITRFDTVNSGYNVSRGGGVGISRVTESEQSIKWRGERFDRSRMRSKIRWEITNHQFKHNLDELENLTSVAVRNMLKRAMVNYEYGTEEYNEESAKRGRQLENAVRSSMTAMVDNAVTECQEEILNSIRQQHVGILPSLRMRQWLVEGPSTPRVQENSATDPSVQQKPDGCTTIASNVIIGGGIIAFLFALFVSQC